MARSLRINTPNTTAINSLVECKAHLRIEVSDDDAYINSLALVAKQTIESYCNIFIMETECTQLCDTWVDTYQLYYGAPKNLMNGTSSYIDVIKFQYFDTAGVIQNWATTDYIVDDTSMPARIGLDPSGDGYPNIENRLNAIEITYDVGMAETDDVPEALKQAALILVGQWYENRQEAVVGRSVGIIPLTARYLMDPYKIQTMGLPTCVL
tara:strand:+ start:5453 stop:6082 length:630 start_codon:yes stop_codon:yes gene_type:complete